MRRTLAAVLLAALAVIVPAAGAEEKKSDAKPALTKCQETFSLKGLSGFYKTSKGTGTITCDNGQSMKVRIHATGGGITFGKSEIIDGTGKFSGARNISELLGSYVQSEANAGAGKSVDAQALTKGTVSLVLSGTGRGVDLGFAFGKFTMEA